MISIKDQIYKALSKNLDNVYDKYPPDFTTLPYIQYAEEDNKVHEWCDDKEVSSYIKYRIDIYDNVDTTSPALEVDKIMSDLGLKRIQSMDVEDKNLKHKQMKYEAIYDIDQKSIYHKY